MPKLPTKHEVYIRERGTSTVRKFMFNTATELSAFLEAITFVHDPDIKIVDGHDLTGTLIVHGKPRVRPDPTSEDLCCPTCHISRGAINDALRFLRTEGVDTWFVDLGDEGMVYISGEIARALKVTLWRGDDRASGRCDGYERRGTDPRP